LVQRTQMQARTNASTTEGLFDTEGVQYQEGAQPPAVKHRPAHLPATALGLRCSCDPGPKLPAIEIAVLGAG
jgi:hypothetical protein